MGMLSSLAGAAFGNTNLASSALSTLGGSALTGGLSYYGVKDTNETNAAIASARNVFEREEALKARDFSAEQAAINRDFQSGQVAKQMEFQERMSSTAIKRRMKDLEASGLNPILATKFDASTPAGAAGTGGIGATAKANAHGYTALNEIEGFVSGASSLLSLQKLAAEVKLTQNKANSTDPLAQLMQYLSGLLGSGSDNPKELGNKHGNRVNDIPKAIVKTFAGAYSSTAQRLREKQQQVQQTYGEWFDTLKTGVNEMRKYGKEIMKPKPSDKTIWR